MTVLAVAVAVDESGTLGSVVDIGQRYVQAFDQHTLLTGSLSAVEHATVVRLGVHVDRLTRSCDIIFLLGMSPRDLTAVDDARSRPWHGLLLGESPFIGVFLAAEVLSALAASRIPLSHARVEVINAGRCPDVADISIGLGVGDLTVHASDGRARSVTSAAARGDVVVDLSERCDIGEGDPLVAMVRYPTDSFLACERFAGPFVGRCTVILFASSPLKSWWP